MEDPTTPATAMLAVVQEVLEMGDKTIDQLFILASTPTEVALVKTAKSCVDLHAHVIRKLLEVQLVLEEGIEQIVNSVSKD